MLDYGETIICELCGEGYPRDEIQFECQLGAICNHCKRELISRGEILTFYAEPTDDQTKK